jgi:hypothetical protein
VAAALAALACLAVVPDAQAGSRLTKSTTLRLPSDGNMSLARLELRASPGATRRRGRIPTPRLRIRGARRLPRDVGVFAAVRRQGRRGRFSAFLVLVNPARRGGASAAQSSTVEVVFGTTFEEYAIIEQGDRRTRVFPNVLNENSPRAGELVTRLVDEEIPRCAILKRLKVDLGSCKVQFEAARLAAQDRAIAAGIYSRIRAVGLIQRTDVQTFRIPPGSGEGSRSVVGFEFNQPVVGVRIESLDGRRITTFEGASSGLRCATTDPFTGFCTFQAPSTGGAFVIGQTPGVPPGTPGIELTPVLPPFQPVAPPFDNRVVM